MKEDRFTAEAMAEAMEASEAATRSIIIIGTANISDHKRRALLSSRSALLMFLQLCYD